MAADNEINVTSQGLSAQEVELGEAIQAFVNAYNNLEDGLSSLTSKGFTGNVSETLMGVWKSKVVPKLEGIRSQLVQDQEFISDEGKDFDKLNRKLDQTMRG